MNLNKEKVFSSKSPIFSIQSQPATQPLATKCMICRYVFNSAAEMHIHMSYEHGVPLYRGKYPSPAGGQSNSDNRIGASQAETQNIPKQDKSKDLSGKPSTSMPSQFKTTVRQNARQLHAQMEKPQKSQIQTQLATQPVAEKCMICRYVFNSTTEMHTHMSHEHGVALYRRKYPSPARGQSTSGNTIRANQAETQNVRKQDKSKDLSGKPSKMPKPPQSKWEFTSKAGTSHHLGQSTSRQSQVKPIARPKTVQPTDKKVFKLQIRPNPMQTPKGTTQLQVRNEYPQKSQIRLEPIPLSNPKHHQPKYHFSSPSGTSHRQGTTTSYLLKRRPIFGLITSQRISRPFQADKDVFKKPFPPNFHRKR